MTVAGQKCEYSTEGPRNVFDGHMLVQYKLSSVRVVKGTIVDMFDESISTATIVLSSMKKGKKVFVGGTYSRDDGSFCFGPVPDGDYLLEVGREGFNKTEVIFKVRSRSATKGLKRVTIEVGT